MEKVSPEKALRLSKELNRQTYFTNPFFLCHNCFIETEDNREVILCTELDGSKNQFFLPEKKYLKKREKIGLATKEDIDKLEKSGAMVEKTFYGDEYIYNANEWRRLEGSKFGKIRKDINNFKRNNSFKVFNKYPKEKIIKFIKDWAEFKDVNSKPKDVQEVFDYELKACINYISLMSKIPNKAIFVEIDKKLAGFAVFLKLNSDFWVCLMQKTNIKIRGLSKFLYHLKALEMEEAKYFTTGPAENDEGLIGFKESLNPTKKISFYEIEYSFN